ncbi:MAG: NUDIX domain-containing protein, partial [bacterium]|nr:NUDIX domain-containing protein [bacterium]
MGLLVALEGIDNVGKSSAARTLAPRLRERGYLVTALSEFGTDAVGRAVRDLVRGSWSEVDPRSQPLLIAADRDPRYRRAFATLSDPRRIVLCDRYFHTAIIYQALGTGVGIEGMGQRLRTLYDETFRPADLVLLFEASVETALARGGGNIHDRPFLEAAARSFRKLALGDKTVIIDAEASQKEAAATCLRAILAHAPPVTHVPVPAAALGQRRSHHAREVLFVPQAASELYLQRKPTYPDGVYRIAGGGVEAAETPFEALEREFEEETGLAPE